MARIKNPIAQPHPISGAHRPIESGNARVPPYHRRPSR
jgi:hypothetical protein